MTTEKLLESGYKKILAKAKKEELTIQELSFIALHEILMMMFDVNALLNNLNNK
jgi:hypothetical protein